MMLFAGAARAEVSFERQNSVDESGRCYAVLIVLVPRAGGGDLELTTAIGGASVRKERQRIFGGCAGFLFWATAGD
jgi:hypothetical protein